ncbi:TIGR01777 family protein [Hazenella sp. IB182357]|uniref:TIGR01777 family protein n=1 Tax=Polycladospora coralii TaxID=2771432 RepID=A0A926N9X6_9BACL|nr:TIGR01777 family oxidoreductase [Polycladospora coralii]MBD1371270.1 TIGR01777 family protein [Polycladospora coralii]
MKIAITGATGLVGTELVNQLSKQGHEITPILRSSHNPFSTNEHIHWNPNEGIIEQDKLEGHDAVIHLAGESIDGRWTDEKKKRILSSRVAGTTLLSETIARLKNPPKVLLSASGISYYGNQEGDHAVDESSPVGSDFLTQVVVEWEKSTKPAEAAGVRVVYLRFGIVLSKEGGALAKMLTPFQIGVGGKIGHGKQMMSWIAIDDVAGVVAYLLKHDEISGPINMVAPNPVNNETFTKTLGEVLNRPTILPLTPSMLRLIFGEVADELLINGVKVLPTRLQETGYTFKFPDLKEALIHLLKK